MNEPGFSEIVNQLFTILNDPDEWGTPKAKLPPCPKCDEDELGVIYAELVPCYRCGWALEESLESRVAAAKARQARGVAK